MDNYIMIQYFEWELPSDKLHWQRLKDDVDNLAHIGVSGVWIPPCCKSTGPNDVGYGVYDLFDLGEFDQKGTIATKYGTKKDLTDAIAVLHEKGLKVYADVVLNHKAAADATEEAVVVKVDPLDRRTVVSEPFTIEAWTRFDFPGRGDTYSSFKWNKSHFSATDYDARSGETAIYKFAGEGKEFAQAVDEEFGNYDFLMYANIDYYHPDVVEETLYWGRWITQELGLDGMRMDAVKHIDENFMENFVRSVRESVDRSFFVVGEYWRGDPDRLREYLSDVNYHMTLFDVPLHFNLFEASHRGRDYDLREIFKDALVSFNPMNVVTFVDNHDSQHRQSLESFIEEWFKEIAYAFILLRKDGYPCLFYGDYYGIGGEVPKAPLKERLDPLLLARKYLAYGEQVDQFDDAHIVGWQRLGDEEHADSGLVAVISNTDDGSLYFSFGESQAGSVWIDITLHHHHEIILSDQGGADFPVSGGQVSVWVKKVAAEKIPEVM